jgi:hypothetical protein
MGLVVTQNPILTTGGEIGLTPDHPIIGWHNIVTPTNISAQFTSPGFPASNMGNPATHLTWKSSTTTPPDYQAVQITTGTVEPLDYVAFARHNLASAAASVSIGYFDASILFHQLCPETILADDGPALFRFPAQSLTNIAIMIIHPVIAPQISVVYAGKLLVLPRKIYQGLAPINYARVAKVTNGRSEAGQFLGRIVMQEFVKNTIPLSLIDPLYFRNYIADFLVFSKANPFFFAWRPQTYPQEIGYCHMTNDPLPLNEAPHGLVAMQMEMTGVI